MMLGSVTVSWEAMLEAEAEGKLSNIDPVFFQILIFCLM